MRQKYQKNGFYNAKKKFARVMLTIWKRKTRVMSCELRVQTYELRVKIHELKVQM